MDVTAHFEQSREHLRQVAYRMLGSRAEADDAVQEAWLRLSRSDTSQVANLTGWLTTVVARVCLDIIRKRREVPLDNVPAAAPETTIDPREEAQLAQTVGLAMLVVLETLDPPERLAFVLHDLFGVPFDQIAEILGRSSDATRQLASRARRRVRGAPAVDEAQLARQRDAVAAVIAALRAGDVERMVALLDPEVVVRAGGRELRGARKWAQSAAAYARATGETHAWLTTALVEGTPAAIVAPHGHLERVLRFTFAPGTDAIIAVDIITDAAAVAALDVSAG